MRKRQFKHTKTAIIPIWVLLLVGGIFSCGDKSSTNNPSSPHEDVNDIDIDDLPPAIEPTITEAEIIRQAQAYLEKIRKNENQYKLNSLTAYITQLENKKSHAAQTILRDLKEHKKFYYVHGYSKREYKQVFHQVKEYNETLFSISNRYRKSIPNLKTRGIKIEDFIRDNNTHKMEISLEKNDKDGNPHYKFITNVGKYPQLLVGYCKKENDE